MRDVPLTEKQCPVCGQWFEGMSNQTYDTPRCQKLADYRRHIERRRQARREAYQRMKQAKEPGRPAPERGQEEGQG